MKLNEVIRLDGIYIHKLEDLDYDKSGFMKSHKVPILVNTVMECQGIAEIRDGHYILNFGYKDFEKQSAISAEFFFTYMDPVAYASSVFGKDYSKSLSNVDIVEIEYGIEFDYGNDISIKIYPYSAYCENYPEFDKLLIDVNITNKSKAVKCRRMIFEFRPHVKSNKYKQYESI